MRKLLRKFGRLLGHRPPAMQVAALCRDPKNGKVLLITSRGTKRWIIPKGWPMPGRSLAAAAAQEAWEEAGVRGTVGDHALGSYHYDKWQDEGYTVPVVVQIFSLQVDKLDETFPETGERRREWVTPAEAARRVDEPELKVLLARLGRA